MEEINVGDPQKLPELKLDAKQAQGFISFFKTLPQDQRAVRFFDRRDYYTSHGEDASFIAKTYYHTTTVLRQLSNGAQSLSTVTVSKNMFETITRDLLLEKTDHTIEVYEGSGSNWRLTKTGTPGNIGSFEEILFANNEMLDSPVVVALYPKFRENGCTLGLSYVNLTKKVFGVAEFLDDSHFTILESELVSLGCKECVLPSEGDKLNEYKKIKTLLVKCSVMLTERKQKEFKSRDLTQDLGRLVKSSAECVRDLVSGLEIASVALGGLLLYLDLLADDTNYASYTINQYSPGCYMRLDSAAMRALNVLESKTDANKNFSLFGLMNRTCTAGMGKRLLHVWLKQPLLDVKEITARLDLVQAFVEDTALRHDLRQHLKRISDIERLVNLFEKKRAGLQHVVKLYQSTIRLPYIKGALERYDGQFFPLIKERYLNHLGTWTDDLHLNKFVALVETSVDLDQLEDGEYLIRDSYDSTLVALKNEQLSLKNQIHNLHEQTANYLDLPLDKGLKLDKGTQFGHVFRITKKEEPKVRKKLDTQFIILETRKDGVKFISTKLKKLGEQYQKIVDDYRNCQKDLVNRVVQTTATFAEVFQSVAGVLSEMDVLLGFADLTSSSPTAYARPEITPSDKGNIILEGSRHPCVEAQDWVNFIPNDCRLVRGKSWTQIITGPNMGGKSTFIRQVGVNVLMAQVGCFVPCSKASISVRDCIYARVGAGDCQLRGVSTFMQEMLETSAILNGATENSLIIIDELGRGTSTYDGFGLAWSICEHVVQEIKAPTLFATHFHELTALASTETKGVSGVVNYHVSAHIDSSNRKLTMLYKIEPGGCDQSFGIHVAEFANFPESVVTLAREKAAELEDFSSDSVSVTNAEPEDKLQPKRKFDELDMARGASRAHRFLKEFSEMPLETMSLDEALQKVKKLKTELEQDTGDSQWLQKLCSHSSSD